MQIGSRERKVLRRLLWPLVRIVIQWRIWGFRQPLPEPKKETYRPEWEDLTWRSITRTIGGGSAGVATVASAILAILIPPLSLVLSAEIPAVATAIVVLAFMVLGPVTIAVASCVAAYGSMCSQSPQRYADTALRGRNESEIITSISYHVYVACRTFQRNTEPLEKYLPRDRDSTVDVSCILRDREYIEDQIQEVSDAMEWQELMLMRLLALKTVAAEELGIPRRRLCDHLLQYSPLIQRHMTRKYVSTWNAVLVHVHLHGAAELTTDLCSRLYQNRRIHTESADRALLQTYVLDNKDLHGAIYALASEHSTSGAVFQYAKALAAVAATALQSIDAANGVEKKDIARDKARTRLKFLFRKQRAYPGFEPHKALSNMFSEECSENSALECISKGQPLAADERNVETKRGMARTQLATLKGIDALATNIIRESQTNVADKFTDYAKLWFYSTDSSDKRIIITHGYSKTVRRALRWGLQTLVDKHSIAEKSLPKIFVMNTEHSEEADQYDARRMVFELTDDRETYLRDVNYGNEELLLSLLGQNSRFMVLLGAENVLADNSILHPRGTNRLLPLLEEVSKHPNGCVVAVAESYKQQGYDLVKTNEFHRYHFDRIRYYDAKLFDKVLLGEPLSALGHDVEQEKA